MHGDCKQYMREEALRQFSTGEKRILLATDVCSRGLDIDNITHIINFDPSDNMETHTHRIGRTARAGKKGEAVTYLTSRDSHLASIVVATMRKAGQEVPKELVAQARENRWGRY